MINSKFILKIVVFILSLSFAWWIIDSGYLRLIIDQILPVRFIAEIIAGVFYTSFLTAPIAVAMLVVLAEEGNPIIVALLGGLGAVLGDLIIIKLFREKFAKDVKEVSYYFHLQLIDKTLRKFKLQFLIPLIGLIVIASPFPDELGLLMLGASKLSYHKLFSLTYLLNTTGILFITIPANLIL